MLTLLRYCRRLHAAGDARWLSAWPADSEFRSGMDYFSSLGIVHVETLVDVGVNEGQFLFPALKYLTPRNVVAVEMLSDLAAQLRSRVPSNVRVYNCAVGATAGSAPLLRSVFSPASSLLSLLPEASALYGKDLRQLESGTVEVRTLDQICDDAGVSTVDLLKIDVQGYDLEVIRGARGILRSTKRIIIEVQFVPVYAGGPLFPAVWQELTEDGFVLSQVFGQCRSKTGALLHADALFIAKTAVQG